MEDNKENSIMKMVNPEFQFEFMGNMYRTRKATLDKAIQYREKIKDLDKDPAGDIKIAVFCIYIMLKDQIPDLTEDTILKNIPADVDTFQILATLGFINPSKLEIANKIRDNLLKKSTGESSL